ncbi:hypothetical protein GMO_25800 [Gluconobacter morbifer G707]|uniref:T6SS Transcription factor RovC-like DNA binding domain-containing protein n=1 Tax=Gluconobacter morbifer G707 TaxID=1088869 RepID=G6XM62_9PROT|nr:hypothetical protein GMO_25800 [Gluconobacter morbifer G707]
MLDVQGQRLRCLLVAGHLGEGRSFILTDDAFFDVRMECVVRMRRFLAGEPMGFSSNHLQLSAQQRQRQVRMLCAHDGRQAGLPYRRIASALFHVDLTRMSADEWRATAYYKALYRLLRDGEIWLNGGYLALLQGRMRGGDSFSP